MKKDNIKSNASFDKMADSLDSTFEGEEEIQKEIEKTEKTSMELSKKDLTTIGLEDAEYMERETKDNIDSLNYVMDILKGEMKVGAKPRMFEVFATLSNSKNNCMKELRELKKIILDHKEKKNKKGGGSGGNTIINNMLN